MKNNFWNIFLFEIWGKYPHDQISHTYFSCLWHREQSFYILLNFHQVKLRKEQLSHITPTGCSSLNKKRATILYTTRKFCYQRMNCAVIFENFPTKSIKALKLNQNFFLIKLKMELFGIINLLKLMTTIIGQLQYHVCSI
jgi:hypothetical protein